MRRRKFSLFGGAAVGWLFAARAQPCTRHWLKLYSRLSNGLEYSALRLFCRSSWVVESTPVSVQRD
jgi:hypothetical protein